MEVAATALEAARADLTLSSKSIRSVSGGMPKALTSSAIRSPEKLKHVHIDNSSTAANGPSGFVDGHRAIEIQRAILT
jgi:hypothetical protein